MKTSKRLTTIKTLQNVGRLKTILGVLAKYGFENFAQKVKLGRFVLNKFAKVDIKKYSIEERLRMSIEELGPTFIKLGQLLATRPDLIPESFCEEFKKLHDQVTPVDFELIRTVLEDQYKDRLEEVFSDFQKEPIGTASIAQVYKATLITGEKVVVKVQRPGLNKIIFEDLNVLYILADLIDTYIPEAKIYNPKSIADEFFKSLELETNFIVEANNLKRFQENFKDWDDLKIPKVYMKISGEKVLVLEELIGYPLSKSMALKQKGIDKEKLIDTGIKAYFKMVYRDGLFHGDMHPGNLFVLADGRLGLIDFGQVGRLSPTTRAAISNMMVALATEDYSRFAYEYVDLAPYRDNVDVDVLSRQIRDLLSPYYGLTLENVNTGQLLLKTTSIAAQNNLQLPAELVLFFKSIVNIETLGQLIKSDFNALDYALDFAKEMTVQKMDTTQILKEFTGAAKDTNSLLLSLPRHLKQMVRKWNSPNYHIKISINEIRDLRKSLNHSSSLLFLGIVIGCLILSSSILVGIDQDPTTIPVISMVGYSIAGFLSLIAVMDYIKR